MSNKASPGSMPSSKIGVSLLESNSKIKIDRRLTETLPSPPLPLAKKVNENEYMSVRATDLSLTKTAPASTKKPVSSTLSKSPLVKAKTFGKPLENNASTRIKKPKEEPKPSQVRSTQFKFKSKTPVKTVDPVEAKKSNTKPVSGQVQTRRMSSQLAVAKPNNYADNFYKKNSLGNQKRDPSHSPSQSKRQVVQSNTNPDRMNKTSKSPVFKNELLEKINKDLSENPVDPKLTNSEIIKSKRKQLPTNEFALTSAIENRRVSQYLSNSKPDGYSPQMPINQKGGFTSKWQSITNSKGEQRTLLNQKEVSKTVKAREKSLGTGKKEASNSPGRLLVFKGPRASSNTKVDPANGRVRDKTLKIDKNKSDMKIMALKKKMEGEQPEMDQKKNISVEGMEETAETPSERLSFVQPVQSIKKMPQKFDPSKYYSNHPRNGDVERESSQKRTREISNDPVTDSRKQKESIEKIMTGSKRSTSSFTKSNIQPNCKKLPSGDFEIIRRIELAESRYPEVLNAFLKINSIPYLYAIGYNSHQGYVRNYNEDRISVVFSDKLENNPKFCRFFPEGPKSFGLYSVFDGHNGAECSEYLTTALHNLLLEQAFTTRKEFKTRIKRLYNNLEIMYKLDSIKHKRSFAGSCSLTVVQYNDHLILVNVGDSRAIMSTRNGFEVYELTKDHKPEDPVEFNRIIDSGGFVYRSLWNGLTKKGYDEITNTMPDLIEYENKSRGKNFLEIGPWRANAGGLSVTRTFGDFEAKYKELGGTQGAIICEPDIYEVDVNDGDFLVIGCDGVFDKLTNREIIDTVWKTIRYYAKEEEEVPSDVVLNACVNNVIKRAMLAESQDNLSVIIVFFKKLF